nr:integrin beta 1C [Halisarca dujardinii]
MARSGVLNLVFLLLSSAVLVSSQSTFPSACSELVSCGACIQSALQCAWCADTSYNGTRCLQKTAASSCLAFLQDPQGQVNITRNEALSSTVQVQPQEVTVSLRPGVEETFNVTVRPSGDFPLDMYFLMDFSASMNDDLATVQAIANDITNTIQSITTNFRLGFGSFIDKGTLPFFRVNQLNSRTISGLYSFKHIVNLTSDGDAFRDAVNRETNSGNNDYPEGGFDGLLQAIVCSNVIGWRSNARHILIYITDAGFHHAADGFVGGAVRPNKGQCVMDGNAAPEYYRQDLASSVDYPSVSQIFSLLVRQEIVPIFTCTSDYLRHYEDLAAEIPGARAARLSSNSNNLLQIIRDEYNRISQTVELSFDLIPGLKVNLTPTNCADVDASNPSICNNVQLNTPVTYQVGLTVNEVTDALRALSSFDIRVVFFGSVRVNINIVTGCDCEGTAVRNSTGCNANGDLVCGICSCTGGFTGTQCGCAPGTSINQPCPTGENGLPCSGNGECICGQCVCSNLGDGRFYSGEMCECSSFNCPVDTSGRRCSGRGSCNCDGECVCSLSLLSNRPYTGDVCECSPDTFSCQDPSASGQDLCSGVGGCMCNRCTCPAGYAGDFCERCSSEQSCQLQNCKPLADGCLNCLLAISDEKVILTGTNCSASCPNVSIVEQRPPDVETFTCDANGVSGDLCSGVFFYVPVNVEDRYTLYVASRPASCPQTVQAWTVAVPLVIALLILGILAVVIAKLIVMYLDYREYKDFAKSTKDVQFGKNANPLFEEATSKVVNPMYDLYMNDENTEM